MFFLLIALMPWHVSFVPSKRLPRFTPKIRKLQLAAVTILLLGMLSWWVTGCHGTSGSGSLQVRFDNGHLTDTRWLIEARRGLNRHHGAPPCLHSEAVMWSLFTLIQAQYQDGLLRGTWLPFCRVSLSSVRLCLRINVPPAWIGPQAYATVFCYIWLHRS